MSNYRNILTLSIFIFCSCSTNKIETSSSDNYIPEVSLVQVANKTSQNDGVPSIELGNEYKKYSKKKGAKSSAASTGTSSKETHSVAENVLLYLPNRFLDLIDILKFDVGVGPSAGAVVRLTKYGQVGIRSVAPFSLRAGLAGRSSPVFLEHSSEFGIGPTFVQSSERTVDRGEFGLGLDLILIGAYLGINLEAIPDFIIGFVGIDLQNDDL
ncbi:MAG: hypothetical protein KBC84_09605 [Proteobacteria bacterium]|nr:hypothetical protein [Pseudomonadota bacterium]